MTQGRLIQRMKHGLLVAMTIYGTAFIGSCGLTDVRDSLIDGALGGVSNAATDAVDFLIINLNELFDPFPDQAVIPTP